MLKWLDPSVSEVAWNATVHPTCSKEEAITKDAREKAIRRATQWFVDSKLLLDQDGLEFVYNTPNPHGTLPLPESWKGAGDGLLRLDHRYPRPASAERKPLGPDEEERHQKGVRAVAETHGSRGTVQGEDA